MKYEYFLKNTSSQHVHHVQNFIIFSKFNNYIVLKTNWERAYARISEVSTLPETTS